MPDSPTMPGRLCVYTALIGQYEPLNEQPMAARSTMPFVCLTDDANLKSKTWDVRLVSTAFEMDAVRSQRDLKLRPHVHLAEFDGSLYIDNRVVLTEPPERVADKYFPSSGISLARHSHHDSIMEEFLQVARSDRDDHDRIFEQLKHYLLSCPDVLSEKPYWGAIMLRDHHNDKLQEMLSLWLAHVLRYSRRDQLSANYAFKRANLSPDVMDIENSASWFHTWLEEDGRRAEKGDALASLFHHTRIRQLELEVDQLKKKNRSSSARVRRRIRKTWSSLSKRLRRLGKLAERM